MFPIFIPFLYPYYIKKEDARGLVKLQRRFISFTLIGLTIVLGIMQFAVLPKVLSLYKEFSIPIPFFAQISSSVSFFAMILLVIVSTILLIKESDYSELDQKLLKYKAGEMIKSQEIINRKKEFIWLVPMFLGMGFIIVSIILPIYNLTNTIK